MAWDSAGVTTGPVTVPLVLAMGVGLGQRRQRGRGLRHPGPGVRSARSCPCCCWGSGCSGATARPPPRRRSDRRTRHGEREITVLTDVALITCIVQKGLADAMVDAAREAGARARPSTTRAAAACASGWASSASRSRSRRRSSTSWWPSDQVDRVFERMFLAGHLDTPGMGFIYVTPLDKAATVHPAARSRSGCGRGPDVAADEKLITVIVPQGQGHGAAAEQLYERGELRAALGGGAGAVRPTSRSGSGAFARTRPRCGSAARCPGPSNGSLRRASILWRRCRSCSCSAISRRGVGPRRR